MVEHKDCNLSEKHKRFCEEYVVDCNQTAALIRAGYSPTGAAAYAHKLMQRDEIKKYIADVQQAIRDRLKLTQDRVINDIIEIKDRCMQKQAVYEYDKESKEYEQKQEWAVNEAGEEVLVGVFTFDASNALKACDMLGKHLGLYEQDNKQKANKLRLEIDRDKVRAIVDEDAEFVG